MHALNAILASPLLQLRTSTNLDICASPFFAALASVIQQAFRALVDTELHIRPSVLERDSIGRFCPKSFDITGVTRMSHA